MLDSLIGRSGAVWGQDGFIYDVERSATGIVRFRPEPSTHVETVTFLDSASGEIAHRLPEVLPNGKGLLFTVYYGGKGRNGTAIAAQPIGSRKHTIIATGIAARFSPSGHLLYVTQNGTLMAVRFDAAKLTVSGDATPIASGVHSGTVGAVDLGVSDTGTLVYALGASVGDRQLIWVSRDGHAKDVDSTWNQYFNYPALSPDMTRLAVALGSTQEDIWVKQLDRGPSLKLTFEGTLNQYPAWTPDGRSVTYESNARTLGTTFALWTKRADGSAQPVIQVNADRDPSEAVWSRDGHWLVVRTGVSVKGTGDIMALRPGVDSALIPLVTTKFAELSPDLSPDGRFLVYSSNETGKQEIYVVPFPNAAAAKWPISTAGGTEPRWSHRGNEIFYRDGEGNMISVPVKTSPGFSFGGPTKLFFAGEYVAYSQRREYDVSADDKRFLMIKFATSPIPDKLVVVTNWFEEVKSMTKK